MIKKILSHSFLYAIGPQVPRLASIFILPLITAYLTAEDYGISALLMAYTGAIGALKDLGVLVLLVNFFFQRTKTWPLLWRRLYGYILAWSPFYLVLQSLVIYAALPESQMHNYWLIVFIYACTNIVFDVPVLFGSRFLQLSQKPLPIAIITALTGIITIFLNLITIVYFKMGYMGWIVSTFIASLFSFLLYAYYTFIKLKLFPIFKFNKKHLQSALKIALPTIPHNYSSYLLNSSDRVLLSFFKIPLADIGKYNLAYGFGSYFEVFSTAVGMAVGPFYAKIFSSNSEKRNELAKHLTYLLQYIFILIGFVLAIWMKEIFSLLISNTELKSSYTISVIIIMAYVNKPFYWSSINLLIYHASTSKLWRITFMGGVLNILLNLVLIPFLGIWAAVINTFISILFINFYGGFLKEVIQLGRSNYKDFYWIIITILLTITALFAVELNIIYKIPISLFFTLVISYLINREHKKINTFNYIMNIK